MIARHRAREVVGLLKRALIGWIDDRAPRMSAALAFYASFSVAPLLLISIGLSGLAFGHKVAQEHFVAQMEGLVGREGARVIGGFLKYTHPGKADLVATLIGVVTLLIGASGVFGELQESFNTIWKVRPEEHRPIWNAVRGRFLSLTLVLGVGFLLLVSLIAGAAFDGVSQALSRSAESSALPRVFEIGVSLVVTSVLFALIFRILPKSKPRWRDAWIGSLLTTFLFSIGKYLIGLYLGHSAFASSYGAAGSFVIFLLWLYYSSFILFYGAEFTRALGDVPPPSLPTGREGRTEASSRVLSPPAFRGHGRAPGP
jgi:membrane protein